ncbi:MAG: BREX-1 system adenine-specific DNA-methyltransferase PglX [Candidatus Cloacimonadaceae bacterium]|jgi:type II restriction/modification system DNA methylase subunit YeeA|nr:BREX-1 system adenine-specific DNA-methyltransferase PglX [Candidatus Cloacimonadaceae bacterium]
MIDKQTNTRLKRFAQDARRYLIDQVNTKLSEVLALGSDAATYEKTKPLYNALLKEVLGVRDGESGEAALKPKTSHLTPNTYHLTPIAERVAYTWFNRLTALRYMDMKHFNPVGIISPQSGDTLPQILAEAKLGVIDSSLIDPSDRDRVLGLLSGTIASTYHKGDAQSEAYRILLLSACNHIGKSLPFLFKPIKDWMELLLPDDLLGEHGILAMIREVMTEDACQDVEVIGWLYQYYISEKKDEVFANVKKGKKVQSAEIPAVTQLFTPHWIVKYMVQNSLGRLWLDSHPKSSLKAKMEYYVAQDADAAESSMSQDCNPARLVNSPEEIKFCDPCCGSGHILTYAFDLLYEIYSEEGYDPLDIPRLIISKNLYGIEIDERASELAAFALSMKAREKDKQWFSRGIDPQICLLENIHFSKDEIEPYLDKCGRDIFTLNFERMLSQFEHADTYGSLIVPHEQDIEGIRDLLNAQNFSGDVFLAPTHNKVLKLIDQADYLSTKYQVVVTNPPYMGKGMSDQLSKYLNENYKDVKSDLFAAFVFRCSVLAMENALIGIMSPNVWMYLSSYEKLRKWMIKNNALTNLVELPLSGFTGATVQICAYNFINYPNKDQFGVFVRLVGLKGADEEMSSYTKQAIANRDCGYFFRCKTSDFAKIPGVPIAYWVSDKIRDIFIRSKPLADVASPKVGLQTGDNDRFLRLWFEVSLYRIGFGMKNRLEARQSGKKWFPYNKGGEFRKWYGNQEFVVNWENDGEEIRNFTFDNGKQRSVVRNPDYYFRESVGWTLLSSSYFGVRYNPCGSIFDVNGMSCFTDTPMTVLGLMISNMCTEFLRVINPTLAFQVGDIQKIPFLDSLSSLPTNQIADTIKLGVNDWDSYETSWDFQQLPILGSRGQGLGVREAYAKLREQWIKSTLKMQELEEENNRIFIEAYGLQDELSPEVPLKEITLTCNPYYRYGVNPEVLGVRALGVREFPLNAELEKRLLADTMKELISYAVGCMFGRYSLDKPGLILANQGDKLKDYLEQVLGVRALGVRDSGSGEAALKPNTQNLKPSFMPDKDNVIPILEGEWFVDDIVSRFCEFLKVAFGAEKYSENISFIEEALGKDLRAYFLKDFYNDHVKRYKKRPIYWLFSSPKGSFNALIYMHRYTPDTVSILLNGYLREYIHKLRAKVTQLEHQLGSGSLSEREKMLTRKEIERLKDIISELEAWESKVILPLAEKRLEIDLDDGVKVNYGKFGEALKRF